MSTEDQKVPVDYIERTVAQAHVVEDLALKQKETGDTALAAQLEVEMEKLAAYLNAAGSPPKRRAEKVIELAKGSLRGRAVTQPLPPLN